MEKDLLFYQNKLNTLLGQILNTSSSVSQNLELRSKLGLPLFYCSIHDPINTMRILTTISNNAAYSPRYSITLVACSCFCFQYIPTNKRKEVMCLLEKTLPVHAVPGDADQLTTFSIFFQSGGAQLIPCKAEILKKIVHHKDPKISLSPKLIGPLVADAPVFLSPIIYDFFMEKSELTTEDLFLIGQIHSVANLPKPSNDELIKKMYENCLRIINDEKATFFDKESALSCLSVVISWDAVTPTQDLLSIDNNSLYILAISCFDEFIKIHGIHGLKPFPASTDKTVKTSYLKLISSALHRKDADLKEIQRIIPHWFIDAVVAENKEYKNDEEIVQNISDVVLNSPCVYDLSAEDIEILSTMHDFIPLWVYVQILRINTKSVSVLQCCIKVVKLAPKLVIDMFFEDFLMFMTNCSKHSEIGNALIAMAKDMTPVLMSHLRELETFILENIAYMDIDKTATLLKLANVFANYANDLDVFGAIFDIIMESFNYYAASLSPSLISTLFTLFADVAEIRKQRHTELMMMALAIVAGPFQNNPPEVLTQKRYILLFNQSHAFFSVIESDVVTDPLFSVGDAFPPLPAALILMSKLTNYDKELDETVANIVSKALMLCPYESALATNVVKQNLRKPIIETMIKMAGICDFASFNIAVSMLTGKETQNVINVCKNDDMRFLIRRNSGFLPLLSQYPCHYHLLFEEGVPEVDILQATALITSTNPVTPLVRRAAKLFGVQQPEMNKYSWSLIEFGNEKLNTLAFAKSIVKLNHFRSWKSASQSKSALDAFRLIYPVSKFGTIEESIVQAIKNYRNYPVCRSYLQGFFTESETPKIIEKSGEKLWILALGTPLTNSYGSNGNEKCKIFMIRNGSKENTDDPETINFIEKVKCHGPSVALGEDENISPSLFLLSKFRSRDPKIAKAKVNVAENIIQIPSFRIRMMRTYTQLFESNEPIDDPSKEMITDLFMKAQMSNPVIANEATSLIKKISQSTVNHSFATNAFLCCSLRDAPISAAWVYESLSVIRKLYKELSLFEGSKSYVKKFYAACSNAKIDITQYPL